MEIRPVSEDMIDTLVSLVNNVFSDYNIPVLWEREEFLKDVRENSISLEDSFIIYEKDPVGFVVTAVRGNLARIDAMGVLAPYRRRGIGEFLLQTALETLRWKKVNKISLEVLEKEKKAVFFYEKHGFSINRRLLTLQIKIRDFEKPYFRFERVNSQVIKELSEGAEKIFHREPNWQRMPETLEKSADRYDMYAVYPGKGGFHPAGYAVWGQNQINSFIVDIFSSDMDIEIPSLISDSLRFIYEKTHNTVCVAGNLPETDLLCEELRRYGGEILFSQLEMELKVR